MAVLLKDPGGHGVQLREEKLAKVPGAQKKGWMLLMRRIFRLP